MSVFRELAAEMGAALEAAEQLVAGLEGAAARATQAAAQIGRAREATGGAEGTEAAMRKVGKAAEDTMSKVEEMKSSQVSPGVGATSQPSQPLKEITAGLLQQAGRR